MKTAKFITAIAMILFTSVVVSVYSCNKSNTKQTKQAEKVDVKTVSSEGPLVMATMDAGGTVTLSVNEGTMLSDWENFLGSNPDFSGIDLTSSNIYEDNGHYYLVATGTVGSSNVKTTLELLYDGGAATDLYLSGIVVVCTTSDCADEATGCQPYGTICTKCGSEDDKCTRSSTGSVSGIFPNISNS